MHETGDLGLVWMSEQLDLVAERQKIFGLEGGRRGKRKASRQEEDGKEGEQTGVI